MAVDIAEASAADIESLLAVRRVVDTELEPTLPPIGPTELTLELFHTRARKPSHTLIARDADVAVGTITYEVPVDVNPTHVYAFARVVPAGRRRGVATALVRAMLERIDDRRTSIATWVQPGAGESMCAAFGLTKRQTVRESELTIDRADLDLMRHWADSCPARARGYQVVMWRGSYPEAWMDQICAAFDAMADAPQDGVEHEFARVTPERVRDGDRSVKGRIDQFGALAIDERGGAAGITELGVNIHRPSLAFQGDTAVLAAHRGNRVGRWLKAANLLQMLAARPDVRRIATANAETNPWMLAINEAMGYRPHTTFLVYQGEVADVATRASTG